MRVIQILPTLAYGDAIGNYTIALKNVLKDMGYKTQIYAERVSPALLEGGIAKEIRLLSRLREEDVIIYHLSTGSELNYKFARYKGKKIIMYHNVTPPEFFRGYNYFLEHMTRKGLQEVRFLADKVDCCIADSEFNKSNLRWLGYEMPIDVLPIVIPFDDYKKKPSQDILDKYKDGRHNIIFTGRVAPNKCHHDIIAAFACYKKYYDSEARLFLVGLYAESDVYYKKLKKYVELLKVDDVVFTGHIKFEEILAYYSLADAFLCMSEHEGFCVPLVEAMVFGVPIIAYNCTAIPTTLGEGGILIDKKDPVEVAALINRVILDNALRDVIRENQKKRLEDLRYDKVTALFREFFKEFCKKQVNIKKQKNKIAIINQRYGIEVNGGSELYSRQIAEKLSKKYEVEVLTSCALDYEKWTNHYNEGEEIINNVTVRRFRAVHERDPKGFSELNNKMVSQKGSSEQKLEYWIDAMGPYCPSLIEYIKEYREEYRAFIVVTYLYYTAVRSMPEIADKAIFIPTAHREPYIDFKIYKKIFEAPKAYIFLTDEERELVSSKFNIQDKPYSVMGVGVDVPENVDDKVFKEKYGLDYYLIYVGRIDLGKECPKMFEHFIEYKKRNNSPLKLVLVGKAVIDIPKHPDIVSLGFVNDEDKFNGIKGAKALVLPSKYESLSISVLEAMRLGVPVIVNGECDVLRGHCTKSNGGMCYNNFYEFENAVNYMLSGGEAYQRMQENAAHYVKTHYDWKVIMEKFDRIIERF